MMVFVDEMCLVCGVLKGFLVNFDEQICMWYSGGGVCVDVGSHYIDFD